MDFLKIPLINSSMQATRRKLDPGWIFLRRNDTVVWYDVAFGASVASADRKPSMDI
jgi:hypothetical protein